MSNQKKPKEIDPNRIFVGGLVRIKEKFAPLCDCECERFLKLTSRNIPLRMEGKEIPDPETTDGTHTFKLNGMCSCGEPHSFKVKVSKTDATFERVESELMGDPTSIRKHRGSL